MSLQLIAWMLVAIYSMLLLFIGLYCFMQLYLLRIYRRARKDQAETRPATLIEPPMYPFITVQLPLYNEKYVAARLIDNIVRLDYPADRLEIQVLDDSTDETRSICRHKVLEYQAMGIPIVLYHRDERTGFKAGALKEGLSHAKGELIAIFDADFLPEPDFLKRIVPYFKDDRIGVVQSRWGHLNKDYSLLTRLQAFQLNVHFTIEQTGRAAGKLFLQFNGTSGIWRKTTIEDAGGWHSDTLTEDLDLSYRAQLKGWRIAYVQDIISPAELPVEMNGLRSQQFRWMKGGAENARKLLPALLKASLPFQVKVMAVAHLMSSAIFPATFLLAVLSVPMTFIVSRSGIDLRFFSLFMLSTVMIGLVYYQANKDTSWRGWSPMRRIVQFVLIFPLYLSFSMGLSLHNSIAVVQGFSGRKSPFIRTPKFNIQGINDRAYAGNGFTGKISLYVFFEVLLAIYFLVAIVVGWKIGLTTFLVYHLMLLAGFVGISFYSIRQFRST